MKTSLLAAFVALLLLPVADFSLSVSAFAQPPGSRGGGEEGSRGGRWRGERGGGERGGGERGGWSRGGGERGGPPGGGWDRGGGERGGPPGGGSRGGRGGFDPSSMIQRMDRNNNGMLEPEEMEGPAQMMISRLQREDPSIRTDRPIPVSKILEAFERMRGGSGDRGSSREETQAKLNEALTPPETLVPGFGEPVVLEPVLGFGPAAELLAVTVTPEDRKSAEELLQRYDRNRDGALSGEEISRRWSGNPMDFDRNGDGKLSLNELALRAARLRIAEAEVQAASNRRSAAAPRPREEQPAEMPDPYNGRRSFASTSRALPEGLPGWFAERDTDGDQQVSMAEYSQQWTASLVAEFQSFDLNGDGVITPSECLEAIRNGATASGASESRSSDSRGDVSRTRSRGFGGERSTSSSSSSSPANSPAPAATGDLDPKMLETAQRIIGRNDKNGDGVLTHDEWKEMLVDPTAADANRDGRITVEEYARWMQARSSR